MKFNTSCNLSVILILMRLMLNTANAYQRYIVINGELMNAAQSVLLDRLNGEYIPDGRYWLNLHNGEWSYEGGPAQGILGGNDYGSDSTTQDCDGQFDYDCKKDSFCERNPGICP